MASIYHGGPMDFPDPWPGDVLLAGEHLRCGFVDKDSQQMVVFKEPDQERVAPTSFGQAARNPKYERLTEYGAMPKGFGLATQQSENDQAYHYAINADCSVHPWICGPAVTALTPATVDSTNGISHFFEVGATLFALNGQYALSRTNDAAWAVAQDFGASKVALDAVAFYSAAFSAQHAFVAMGDSDNFWYFDGTSWAQHASLKSRCFAVVGREFYRVYDTNMLSKCDTNASPLTAGNWRDVGRIGDKSQAVIRMFADAASQLIMVKADSIYTVNPAGEDQPKFPFLRFAPDANAGKGWGGYLNDAYLPFNNGLWKLTPSLQISPAGPERQTAGSSAPVRGRITAFCGHDAFHAYGALYNGTDSYVGKMLPDGTWHASITSAFASQKIQVLHKSTAGATAGWTRLYLGSSTGVIRWFQLPNDAYPAADSGYSFSTTAGEVYLPLWSGGFLSDPKGLRAVTIGGPFLNGSNYAQFDYKTTPTASSWTALGENFDSAGTEKEEFAISVSATLGLFRVQLLAGTSSATPRVSSVAVHWRRRPPLSRVVELPILCEDGLLFRNGVPCPLGAVEIRDFIESLASATSTVSCTLPTGEAISVDVTDYRETTAWDDGIQGRTPRSAIQVELAEIVTSLLQGSYRAMNLRTYGQLEAQGTYGRLMTLL